MPLLCYGLKYEEKINESVIYNYIFKKQKIYAIAKDTSVILFVMQKIVVYSKCMCY